MAKRNNACMRILAVDIGNTRVSLGFFECGSLVWRRDYRVEEAGNLCCDDFAMGQDLTVVSCVSRALQFCLESVRQLTKGQILEVNPCAAPLTIHYDRPECLGQDRVVNALGALHESPQGAIVVDLGTATHFDIVNSNGEFWGGPIMAGLMTFHVALSQRIPHLPCPELAANVGAVCSNTENAVLAGSILGMAGGIGRILDEITRQIDFTPTRIITGGYAPFLEPHLAYDKWIPNLTLYGLLEYGMRCFGERA